MANSYRRFKTPTVIQMEAVECGVASLSIILGYFGKFIPLEQLRVDCGVSRDGSNAANILKTAEKYGLHGEGFKYSVEDLKNLNGPAILFWEFRHFLVLEGFSKEKVFLNDPDSGPRGVSYEEFEKSYNGIALCFEKTENFQKSGRPVSFLSLLYSRIKTSGNPLAFLLLTGICLLLPGFAMPAFYMYFISTFYAKNVSIWHNQFLLLVGITCVFAAFLNWIQSYFLTRLYTKLSIGFSNKFIWHLLHLPMSFYTQRYSGEISYRISLNDSVAKSICISIISSVIDVFLILFYAAVMFTYDFYIALIALCSAVLNLVLMLWVYRSRIDAFACLQKNMSLSLAESIGGLQYIESIKSKGAESDFFSKWAGLYSKTITAHQKIGVKDTILDTFPQFFQMLTITAVLGIGGMRILNGSLTVPMLMAMQLLMVNFLKPVSKFVGYSQLIQNTKIEFERLDDVLKNKLDPLIIKRKSLTPSTEQKKMHGRLEFRNVCFRYSPVTPLVIDNLSFVIEPGKRLAVVGPTGSGKSTIAKLAVGLFYPESGEILYDGVPLSEIPIDLFRRSVATVDQEFFLFEGSFRDNLTLWNPSVPDELLVAASTDACIHDVIIARPSGYDSKILEAGSNLSGGQRQRIEIARAFLNDPSVIILDEATSALDSKTEKFISDRIRQRCSSALVIAHRLSTIQDSDEIIVLNKGIAEQRGTHEKLKNIPGIYQDLVLCEGIYD